MGLFLVTIFLVALVSILTYFYFTRNFNYWKDRNIPYVKPTPFFGNLLVILALNKTIGEWFRDKYNSIDADYFGMFALNQPILVVKSPQLIKDIFIKDFSHFSDRTVTVSDRDIMSKGIFFSKNPTWKRLRSKISPIFSSAKLKLMFPLMQEIAKQMTDYIGERSDATIEMKEACAKYSTNVIARCAFAVEAKSFQNENAEFRQIGRNLFAANINNISRQFAARFAPAILRVLRIDFLNPILTGALREIFLNILRQRESSGILNENDFLGLLLQLKEERKDDEDFDETVLLAQAIQIFAAGFETVASTMGFAFYELGISPDIQEKLRGEIFENIKKNDGLTYEGINEMKYLDMVVCETLRKYPVLPFLDRRCTKDFVVPDTTYTIKKGTGVFVPLFGLHCDEKYFPKPANFDPERFRDKNEINKDGITYLPFGEGPRICMGNRFGLLNVKIGIVSVLSKYRLAANSETPVPLVFHPKNLILASTVGIPLTLTPLA